jgi:type III pantothenate kinase
MISPMILTIDIGNSYIKWGLWEGSFLEERFSSKTSSIEDDSALDSLLHDLSGKTITAICGCSVVPVATATLSRKIKETLGLEVKWITGESELGIGVDYLTRATLGSDRLVAAFGAFKKYGGPAIVCDFGTATTMDLIRADGTFAGGLIAPGFRMLSDSLGSKAAQLFSVEIEKPESIIGTSTETALKSGIFLTVIGTLEGAVSRMRDELNEKPKVIATGGHARLVATGTDVIDIIDDDLVLFGLLKSALGD